MTPSDDPVIPLPAKAPACPICGKPATAGHRPFCSPRCRNVDLHRWLQGSYRVETEENPDEGSSETDER
jgi:endogenous inhibitor of DNA gyrase (YacG/DUF329 family)